MKYKCSKCFKCAKTQAVVSLFYLNLIAFGQYFVGV